MIQITDDRIERYIYDLLPKSPGILPELEGIAKERRIPIIGPLVGRFLYILARASRARRILEVGTAIGYSTIWLGLAARQNKGKVITVEIDRKTASEARSNIARAGLGMTVRIIEGDGVQVIPKLKGRFDMIFVDENKENYPRYIELCFRRLSRNGLMVADNALWSGAVLEGKTEEAAAIARFNKLLMKKMPSVIIPARDGVAVGIK